MKHFARPLLPWTQLYFSLQQSERLRLPEIKAALRPWSRSLHRPSTHSRRRKRCRIQATRGNIAQQERQELEVPPGLWPREHLPVPRPQQVAGFPGAAANGNRGAGGARCFVLERGLLCPLKPASCAFTWGTTSVFLNSIHQNRGVCRLSEEVWFSILQ